MKIVGVNLTVAVLGEDGEPKNIELLNHVVQAGYEVNITMEKKFDTSEDGAGAREFVPTGESDVLIRFSRKS